MAAELPNQSPLDFDGDVELTAITPPAISRAGTMPVSVTELNRRTRTLIEAKFELLWVTGELSNLTRAVSGHYYFLLKDDAAQVRCVMFRQRAAALGFKPENGMQVDVRALPSLYEARGEFQLGVEGMRQAGLGALFEAYERLKNKLAAEGIFDAARKRALPTFPKKVGIVTSLQAAGLRDVLTTLKRRAPMIAVILYPTAVQGATAAREIAAAIDTARTRHEVDVLIVCRGGGSIEDLWSFNAEIVARAILRLQVETAIPVVSGVGHETDFTICDFVADQRAPTPTAAAEIISPDVEQLRTTTAAARLGFVRALRRTLDNAYQKVDRAQRSLLSPQDRLRHERERLAQMAAQLRRAVTTRLDQARFTSALLRQRLAAHRPDLTVPQSALQRREASFRQSALRAHLARAARLQGLAQALHLLAPERVLERGYSIVEHDGAILRDSTEVRAGDTIAVQLARGRIKANVQ